MVQADVDEARGLRRVARAPARQAALAAESAGAEAENGNVEAGTAELAIFHWGVLYDGYGANVMRKRARFNRDGGAGTAKIQARCRSAGQFAQRGLLQNRQVPGHRVPYTLSVTMS